MKTLAVLYICTGAYVAFWRDFYPNFKANFLPDCDRTFFVFTDADHIAYEDAPDVRRIPQQALPWPYSTMQRFDAFLGQEAALAKFDYLFFANANLHCTRVISAAELLPDPAAGQTLTAVCHLPYYGRAPMFHPYDRSGKSRASIPYNCGQYYVAGGLNGGTAAAFLALCRELKARTDEDLQHAGGDPHRARGDPCAAEIALYPDRCLAHRQKTAELPCAQVGGLLPELAALPVAGAGYPAAPPGRAAKALNYHDKKRYL